MEQFAEVRDTRKLTDISSPKQWKTVASKDLLNEGYPVYGANGVIGYYQDYNHENPTVLITCRGATCGTINVSCPKAYINGNAMCIDNLISDVDYRYLQKFLEYYNFSDIITGSAQPQITIEGLKNVDVKIPTLDSQQAFIQLAEQTDKSKLLISNLIISRRR